MRIQVTDPFHAAADPKMPILPHALDPDEVQRRFDQLRSPESLGWERLRLREIRVLRHKPGRRCLIQYDFSPNGGGAETAPTARIGKLRARGPDAATYRLSEALAASGFHADSDDGIAIPQPVGLVPDLHMWLQNKVPGSLATDALAGPGGVALARRIADAAHKIHSADIDPGRCHTMADEQRILHDRLRLVGGINPSWSARLSVILDACDRLGAALTEPAPKPIHRDFYPDQVIVDGHRLYLLDFDLCCLGDPALDIGNFVGHLKEYALRHLGDPEALAEQEEALKERFAQLSGPQVLPSVRAYTTLTLVRHIYLSTQFADRRKFTGRLLELCERRLGIAAPKRLHRASVS